MNNTKKKLRAKGFTLMELIIVLAIIGILIAILGPTMTMYLRKSRIKSSNADAKMVYNAAQTAAQNYISIDRLREDSKKSPMKDTLIVSYFAANQSVTYRTTYDTSDSVTAAAQTGESDAVLANKADINGLVNYVNRTVSNGADKNWTIVIEGYIVKGAVSATSTTTNVVGYYTSNRSQATDISGHTYTQWLDKANNGAASGSVDSLRGLQAEYEKDVIQPMTLAPTEAATGQ